MTATPLTGRSIYASGLVSLMHGTCAVTFAPRVRCALGDGSNNGPRA
jgi:hypothetical protein